MDRIIVEKTEFITKLKAVEVEKESLNNEKNTLKDRLNDAEKDITTLKEEAEYLNTERETLLNKLNELEQNTFTLKNERDVLETTVREIEQEKASLEVRLIEKTRSDEQYETFSRRLQDIAAEAKKFIREKDNEIALLKSSLEAAHLRILEMLTRL